VDMENEMEHGMSHGEKKGYDKYELENACDTLLKAEMIKQDAKMMEALKPYLEKKAKATQELTKITSIDGLKKVAKKKEMEGY